MNCCCCVCCFSARHLPCVRYKCNREETPDVLFFGDSSMDYLKHTLPWGPCTGETREGWNALRKRLRPLVVDNMAMSSAPSYEMCCTAPLFLCLPCSRPKRAIVMSMGGNDFLWLPFPFVHEALSKIGLDAPLQYMRCFLQQTSVFSPNLNIIFIPDTVINENLCCSEAYAEYCARLRDLASVRNFFLCVFVYIHSKQMLIQIIVEPDASNDEVKQYLTSATYYDNRKSVDVPTFNYRVVDKRKKSGKYYQNFILVDPSRFLRRLKKKLDSSTY